MVSCTASRPFFASPTTSISPSDSIKNFKDLRKFLLSSARRTVICFIGKESVSSCLFILFKWVSFKCPSHAVESPSCLECCSKDERKCLSRSEHKAESRGDDMGYSPHWNGLR